MARIRARTPSPNSPSAASCTRWASASALHRRDLPGTPDIVLPGRRKAIFVHGCFWHGHGCRCARLPKSRVEYWGPKIAANRARDGRKAAALRREGWSVACVWECQLRKPAALERRLARFLDG